MTRKNISKAVGNISTCYVEEAENYKVKKRGRVARRFSVSVATIAISVILVGFTYRSTIIDLLSGGYLRIEKNSTSTSIGLVNDPVEIRNGEIYFILDGSNKNITKECSEVKYYQYETIGEDGEHHIILIGGTVNDIGWAEFVILPNGDINMSAEYNGKEPAWLRYGKQKIEEMSKTIKVQE